jgi:putative DNA primase/helicase
MSVKRGLKRPEKMPVKFENIPEEMRNLTKHWAYWKWSWEKGKWTKVPFTFDGVHAKSNDENDWGALRPNITADIDKEGMDGVGFRLPLDEDGFPEFTCVDIDNCRNRETSEIEPWVKDAIKSLNSYTEVSPSGEGVKIFMQGPPPEGDFKTSNGNFEVFTMGRYLCVTGHHIYGEELAVAEDSIALETLMVEHLSRGKKQESVPNPALVDMDEELERLSGALEYLDDDDVVSDYHTWINFGIAIKRFSDTDEGFAIWDKWSSLSGLYDGSEDCRKQWDSFQPREGGVTVGTIYFMARERGWHPPRRAFTWDDTGVARKLAQAVAGRICYIREWKEFYYWDGRKFAAGGEGALVDAIEKLSHDLVDEADDDQKEEMRKFSRRYRDCGKMESLIKIFKRKHSTSADAFNKNPNLLSVENGILEFKGAKFEFKAHDPANLVTHCAPVSFNPKATAPRWKLFIKEVTGQDAEMGEYLQKLMGVCLTGQTPEEAVYILHGDGCNGKSLFIEIAMKMLGKFANLVNQAAIVDDKKSTSHETELFACYNSRMVVTEETDAEVRLRENQIKAICSNGLMKARELYTKPITFERTHKLFMTTNHLPYIKGTDNGVWRRIRVIPFKVSFLGKEDKGLAQTLKNELSGILNWALEGYTKYQQEGLKPPLAVLREIQQFQGEMDTLGQFLEDEILVTRNENDAVSCQVLYDKYKYWSEERGMRGMGSRTFMKDILKRGGVEKKKKRIEGKPNPVWCLAGVRFIT